VPQFGIQALGAFQIDRAAETALEATREPKGGARVATARMRSE
jgi:hypothetical protein